MQPCGSARARHGASSMSSCLSPTRKSGRQQTKKIHGEVLARPRASAVDGAGLRNAFSVTVSVCDRSRTSREVQRFITMADCFTRRIQRYFSLAGCTRHRATLIYRRGSALRSRRKSPNCVFRRGPHDHLPRNSSDFVNLLHDCAGLPAAPGEFHADSGSTLGKRLHFRFGIICSVFPPARAVGVATLSRRTGSLVQPKTQLVTLSSELENDEILDFFHGL